MSTLPQNVTSEYTAYTMGISVGSSELFVAPRDSGGVRVVVYNGHGDDVTIDLNIAEMRVLGEYLVARSYAEERENA